MQKLQQVAPQMKAIKAKYKDDKQRRHHEIMKFYKENEINPFASFLPLVAQIPVFIGLFYTLRTRLREDICPGLQAAYRHAFALHHNIPLKEAGPRRPARRHRRQRGRFRRGWWTLRATARNAQVRGKAATAVGPSMPTRREARPPPPPGRKKKRSGRRL